jgi:hypothetical protein
VITDDRNRIFPDRRVAAIRAAAMASETEPKIAEKAYTPST